MKRFFLFLFFLVFCFLVTPAYSLPPNPYNHNDMPGPPALPNPDMAYAILCEYNPGGLQPGAIAWYIAFADEDYSIHYADWNGGEIHAISLIGSASSKIGVYRCYTYYDTASGSWQFNGWHTYISYPSSGSQVYQNQYLMWNSHDILDNGVVAHTANPWVTPPPGLDQLIMEEGVRVVQAAGGTVSEVLPICLILLAVLLVPPLVYWLIRSYLLRNL